MRTNKLNLDKTEVLLVGTSLILRSGCTLMLDRVTLMPKASVDSWGVLLDLGLLFGTQGEAMARCTFYQIGWVRQLHIFRYFEIV